MTELHPSVARTLEIFRLHPDRFMLVGSYGRAALLGDSIADASEQFGTSKRFQDIDVLDLSRQITSKHSVPSGAAFDSLLTRQYQRIDALTWGLFDRHIAGEPPVVTIDDHLIPTLTIDIPDVGPVLTFGAMGHLMQTHSLDYIKAYTKHPEQVARVHDLTEYQGSEVEAAMKEYNAKMQERHTTKGFYRKLQRGIFKTAPGLALAISDGIVGSVVRTIRSTEESLDPIDESIFAIPHEESVTPF